MKIPSSPSELAGCYEVRQVLGQSDEDLVSRGDETVVRWEMISMVLSAGGWALDHPGESHFERAWCLAQNKGNRANSISARAHLAQGTRIV